MSSRLSSLVTVAFGAAITIAALAGVHTNYVRAGLRWPLVLSGVIVMAAGIASSRFSKRSESGTGAWHSPGVGLLLIAFVVALLTVPPPLGARAAQDRIPNRGIAAADSSRTVADGAAIDLYAYVGYVYFDPESVLGTPVTLEGFIADEPDIPGAVRLTRYVISCCAADAIPIQVTLVGSTFTPDADEWVEVVAVWNGDQTAVDEYGDGVPVLEVISMERIERPSSPYES